MQWIPTYKCCKDYILKNFPCQLPNRNMCECCVCKLKSSRLTEVKNRHADIWYAYVLYHSWHEPKKEAIPNSPPFWSMSVIQCLAWTLGELRCQLEEFHSSAFPRSPFQHSLQLCQHYKHKIHALAQHKTFICVFFLFIILIWIPLHYLWKKKNFRRLKCPWT